MAVEHLFTQALGLASPWKVITCNFDPVARVPRITTSSGAVKTVEVPWARAAEYFPKAQLCFDRFHVMKLCGESLEAIRKEVAREHGGLPRGALWALRGNPENLKEEQRSLREQICKEHGRIARALSIREFLSDLWNYQLRGDAEQHLEPVLSWCSRSRMQPFIKFGKTLRRHMDGILGYFNNYTTSAAIEAVNGLLQLARRRARGYRTFRNFQAMAYWIAGGLTIQTCPVPTH